MYKTKQYYKKIIRYFVLVISLAMITFYILAWLPYIGLPRSIEDNENESDMFRKMKITEKNYSDIETLAAKTDETYEKVLATVLIYYKYNLPTDIESEFDTEKYKLCKRYYDKNYKDEYKSIINSIEAIWKNVVYFPIPKSQKSSIWVNYIDSWGYERTYGGNRVHEGTDLMADNNKRGYLPIVSMTNGVIENIGWLEKGGYRVGIRSENGGYFYYAHLYSFADNLKKGANIKAGQIIGYMGDTGYSKVEGTIGNFDTHLHFGVYIKTDNYEELSINPYWLLKHNENKVLTFSY